MILMSAHNMEFDLQLEIFWHFEIRNTAPAHPLGRVLEGHILYYSRPSLLTVELVVRNTQ